MLHSYRYSEDDKLLIRQFLWDFKFSRRRVWCSELSSGLYCRVKSTIILHGSTTQKTALNKTIFAKKEKYEHGGRLIFTIDILFYGGNSWKLVRRQTTFCTMKGRGHTYNIYLNHYFLWRSFWMSRYFEVLRLCWDKRRTTLRRIL
jgi:hypothetical protein